MKAPFKYLVNDVNSKIAELKKITEERYGKGTAPKIHISYELNSANALGTHIRKDNIHYLNFNPELLNELKDTYINEVVTHEYAHACVVHYLGYYKNGKRVMPHGREFKSFCYGFGIDGKATTKIAINSKVTKQRKRRRGYIYVCDCNEYDLSAIRHNRVQKENAVYRCKQCKGSLTFKKKA